MVTKGGKCDDWGIKRLGELLKDSKKLIGLKILINFTCANGSERIKVNLKFRSDEIAS